MINKRIERKKNLQFSEKLFHWHKTIDRRLPWTGIKDAYKIWLAEIILQQTRVEQGLPYYQKFVLRFPTVFELANAEEDEVLKLWQGLGYYSRARNMHHTAKEVVLHYNASFPTRYEHLIKLKGIGDYSASAISSFAANEAHAVVDGNVVRVLSRVFGINDNYQSTAGKKLYKNIAQQLLPEKKAGKYNQAIMDFGALQCVPRNPDCKSCVFNSSCVAFKKKIVHHLPQKRMKVLIKKRYFNYFIIEHDSNILLQRRTASDIWKGLYQLPLIETEKEYSFAELLKTENSAVPGLHKMSALSDVFRHKQKLTHLEVHFAFYKLSLGVKDYRRMSKIFLSVAVRDLDKYSFPRTLAYYINISLSSTK